ncbi:hypothetical protein SAMN05444143_105139 [Flavobacterium succinicans]|uniref:Uncharacterized protein n=1 Tax=Flavobacterium succinicans TaxID=29536 RepID=A0A1I4VRK8_9FLAO|nr:hypothetical protein [Flavobacterium succinicans]SFN03908.1 hypothetical protein SAMN05444143_105139 [Flavobacterium succinicans]
MLFIGCIQSCSTEESVLENNAVIKTVTKKEAIQFLKKYDTTLGINSKNTALIFDFNKITQEKLINTSELLTVVPVFTKAKKQRTRALLLKVENSIETILYNEYPDASSTKSSFTGIILMTKLNGDFIRAYRLKNNEYDVELAPTTGTKTNKLFPSKDVIAIEELNEVIIKNNYKKPSGYIIILEFTPPSPTAPNNELIWEITGGGGGSEEIICGSGYIQDEYGNCVLDDQIIVELTGKEKCLNDLLDKNGTSFVKNLLANFKGNSEFNIKIVSKDKIIVDKNGITEEVNGNTKYIEGSNLITIEISTTRTNEHATLDVARTILHEYIHADIFRKLNTTTGTLAESLDFKITYEAYGNQHGAMGALYIDSMKEALKAFHRDVLTDDYNKYTNYFGETPSDVFYEALAWSGLKESNVKSWTDLSAEKKAAIEALAKRVPLLSKTVTCPD